MERVQRRSGRERERVPLAVYVIIMIKYTTSINRKKKKVRLNYVVHTYIW